MKTKKMTPYDLIKVCVYFIFIIAEHNSIDLWFLEEYIDDE